MVRRDDLETLELKFEKVRPCSQKLASSRSDTSSNCSTLLMYQGHGSSLKKKSRFSYLFFFVAVHIIIKPTEKLDYVQEALL